MKPSWDIAPKWAKFSAMDENGAWYWYEEEPKLIQGVGYFTSTSGKMERANFIPDFANSVERKGKQK